MGKPTLLDEGDVGHAATPDLLDRAPCGFISFRDDGTIIYANATLGHLLGVDVRDLVGESFEKILSVPARIFYQTHFFPLIKLHGRAEEIYLTLRAHSGAAVHVLANAVRSEVAGTVRIDCVMLRIHERQKYEQELLAAKKTAEAANASKMRFLSMVSHDLRTPLGAISGYADVLLLGARGEVNEAQAQDLRRIKEVSRFLLGLLDDILTFARAEAGALTVSRENVGLERVLERVEAIVAEQFEKAGVAYTREPGPVGMTVCGDADRLQQILLNLLGNASKFTPSGGQVSVRWSTDGQQVHIAVADTGRGIPEELLSQIFEPFVQVNREIDARAHKGIGLGLAISRELARAMGGDITVQSAVGQGSTFIVALPAA
ncbi:MAG TPA: HAMP domain-containing sensor histidine kinase [Gemmatimonadaceae bacterium]|nr:HAMP domain-containing sensor histidine kinase [Gemmatimonadaceae bacterium]